MQMHALRIQCPAGMQAQRRLFGLPHLGRGAWQVGGGGADGLRPLRAQCLLSPPLHAGQVVLRHSGYRSAQLAGRSVESSHLVEHGCCLLPVLLHAVDNHGGHEVALVRRFERLVAESASLLVGQNATRGILGQARVVVQNFRACLDDLIQQLLRHLRLLRLRRVPGLQGRITTSIKVLKQAAASSFRCLDLVASWGCHTRSWRLAHERRRSILRPGAHPLHDGIERLAAFPRGKTCLRARTARSRGAVGSCSPNVRFPSSAKARHIPPPIRSRMRRLPG